MNHTYWLKHLMKMIINIPCLLFLWVQTILSQMKDRIVKHYQGTFLYYFMFIEVKFKFPQVAQKVEDAVTREVMRKLSDDKKMAKKEKDER